MFYWGEKTPHLFEIIDFKMANINANCWFLSPDRNSYAEKVFAQIKSNSENQQPPPPEKKKEIEQQQQADPMPLKIRDRVVWISDENPEYGVVKWIGHLPDSDTSELVAGIEFVSIICVVSCICYSIT